MNAGVLKQNNSKLLNAALLSLIFVMVTGLVVGAVFGVPVLVKSVNNATVSAALTSVGESFSKVTGKLPSNLKISGSFTGKGSAILTEPKTELTRSVTIELDPNYSSYKVNFSGTIKDYEITTVVDKEAFVYKSTTKKVTHKNTEL